VQGLQKISQKQWAFEKEQKSKEKSQMVPKKENRTPTKGGKDMKAGDLKACK